MDASLFEKYSLDRPDTEEGPISFEDVFRRLENEGRSTNAFKELRALMNLLEKVATQKALICQNFQIIDEYNNYIEKLPDEMHEMFKDILSDDDCLIKIDKGKFTSEDFKEIKDSELVAKEIYLDIASALNKKTIVSTQEDKENIYSQMPSFRGISRHRVLCKYTWDHLKYVNSRN